MLFSQGSPLFGTTPGLHTCSQHSLGVLVRCAKGDGLQCDCGLRPRSIQSDGDVSWLHRVLLQCKRKRAESGYPRFEFAWDFVSASMSVLSVRIETLNRSLACTEPFVA